MKILAIGDGGVFTGFARVLHSIFDNLDDSFEIHHLAVNYLGDPVPTKANHHLYPASLGGDLMGFGRLRTLLAHLNPDLIFILNDLWLIKEYLKILNLKERSKTVIYFPVDAIGSDLEWLNNFEELGAIVAYTDFGKNEILKLNPYLPVRVIPHGVTSKIFHKIPKEEALASLSGLTGDEFIVLNANRNQPRKRMDLTIQAFSKFAKDKPSDKVKLYLHTGLEDEGWNIYKMALRYGIDDKLVLTSVNLGPQSGVPDDQLNAIYNVSQIGLSTTLGEGWGLVNIEHAITGGVQVVPNSSSLTDLYSDCGKLINISHEYTYPGILTIGQVPDVDHAAQLLNELYYNPEMMKDLSEKSIAKFTDSKYSWVEIAKQWKKVFESVI